MIAYQLVQLQNLMEMQCLNGYEQVEDKGEVYSTEEQRIGTWIDGKPLYRKVIDTLTLPSNATVEYDITNLNIATITKLYGTASYNNGQLAKPLPFVSSGTSQIRLDVNDKKIRLITYESWSPYPSAIVIEYTKTTDQKYKNKLQRILQKTQMKLQRK